MDVRRVQHRAGCADGLPRVGIRHVAQHPVQRSAVEMPALQEHGMDAREMRHVLQRVGVEQYQIGIVAAWARITSSTAYCGIHCACSEYKGFLPGAQYIAFSKRAISKPESRVTNRTFDG